MTEHSDHPFETDQLATAGAPDFSVAHPPLKLDVSRYMHLIDPSIPEHQQRQMIEALWRPCPNGWCRRPRAEPLA